MNMLLLQKQTRVKSSPKRMCYNGYTTMEACEVILMKTFRLIDLKIVRQDDTSKRLEEFPLIDGLIINGWLKGWFLKNTGIFSNISFRKAKK